MAAASAAAAGALAGRGVRAGDRVVLRMATSCRFVDAYLGALRIGAVVAPLNPDASEREATHVARDADPALTVDDAAGLSGGRTAPAVLDRAEATDPALLMYTSGTTGTPKGALLSHGNLLGSAAAVGLAWRWSPRCRATRRARWSRSACSTEARGRNMSAPGAVLRVGEQVAGGA